MLGLLAINSPGFRKWFDKASPLVTSEKVQPRSRWTRTPFYILGFMILFGQTIDILIAREHWPFSHFPMYTGIQKTDYSRNRIDGVLEDGTEISLTDYFVPLSPGKVSNVVSNYGRKDPVEHAQRCAKEYFDWYEFGREKKRHAGPKIYAARVYSLHWVIQEDAGNIDDPKKVLLGEYNKNDE
jgi:hypothetical protein